MKSRIEKQVMASVGVVYAARTLFSRTALELYAFLLAAWGLVQLTWVHRVFENWTRVGLDGTWQFVSHALTHTSASVQMTLLVLLVAGAALAWDIVRSVRQPELRFA